jgi:hypothetical protein
MNEAEIIAASQEAIYSALFKFARSQGMTEAQALVYAAQWDGAVYVAGHSRSSATASANSDTGSTGGV